METKAIPTKHEIKQILKDRFVLFEKLTNFIEDNYQVDGVYKFSKKNGWTVFYKKSGKALCYINIKDDGFNVTVVIGASLNDEFKKLPISSKTKKMFMDAKQFHDGKWLNFDVKKEMEIEDIKTLLVFKKKPKKII